MEDITAIILTKNEETNVKECIESIYPLVDRIVIVDSFSNDKTKDICCSYSKVSFFENHWINYSKQFNFALENCQIQTKWVLRIDADERLTPKVIAEIKENLTNSNKTITGYVFRYKIKFLGRFLKHGGSYPFLKLALFRYGVGQSEQKNMDEHIVLKYGNIKRLKNDCIHDNCKSISDYIAKHNDYSSREVIDYLNFKNIKKEINSLTKSDRKKTKLKFCLYYKFPLFLRAKLFFIFNYYFKLGFLDGKAGKCYIFLQSYWYRFLVDTKIYEKSIENENFDN